jgi:hypothetical protein
MATALETVAPCPRCRSLATAQVANSDHALYYSCEDCRFLWAARLAPTMCEFGQRVVLSVTAVAQIACPNCHRRLVPAVNT